MACFCSAFSILHSFEQITFRLDRKLGLPERLAAVKGIFKIQSSGHAQASYLAFIYQRHAVDQICNAGIPAVFLAFIDNFFPDIFAQTSHII